MIRPRQRISARQLKARTTRRSPPAVRLIERDRLEKEEEEEIKEGIKAGLEMAVVGADFISEMDLTWGGDRAKITQNGSLLQLSLDRASEPGFQSKQQYLFGKIDMQIKLVLGDSAGTLSSENWDTHDEIDYEFLGNVSGQPYIVHTNVYTLGKGNREQQFYLRFDPRLAFHAYSVVWNPQQILFSGSGTPIRVFRNSVGLGVPYPKSQPMRLYSSL
ncbi:hypothetical protein Sjap_011491 [Stephania japonica]|uniref:GH16 domain-containing protein n=1 Tax=Stephania japonica TaxID=461633 RepID=A0AAP0P5L3_9MAGN